MKINQRFCWLRRAIMGAGLLVLAACSGGGGHSHHGNAGNSDSGEVPNSVGASSSAFVAFIQGLSRTDETSEPLTFKTSFMAPPADEEGEAIALQ